eukprot:6438392-Amphidinium_carterae.1
MPTFTWRLATSSSASRHSPAAVADADPRQCAIFKEAALSGAHACTHASSGAYAFTYMERRGCNEYPG